MVFVIDSTNKERLDEAQNELVKLVAEKELKDAFILILLNKQVILNQKYFGILKDYTETFSGYGRLYYN